MATRKFDEIYNTLLERIENEEYYFNTLIPSETILTKEFECSRNTVRRAIKLLAEQGYLQSIKGKGVIVIYRPIEQSIFKIGNIESLKESSKRNRFRLNTKVILFEKVIVNEEFSKISGFKVGEELYHLKRLRYIKDTPAILDENFFSVEIVKGLDKSIAFKSIYEYIENELQLQIATSLRRITVEKANSEDKKLLDLGSFNCVAVVSGAVLTSYGEIFEYTISKHRPDFFSFEDVAIRLKG